MSTAHLLPTDSWSLKHDLTGINWNQVADLYKQAPLYDRPASAWQRAFEASFACVFAATPGPTNHPIIVGAARANSDGVFYASVFDVAVDRDHQHQGIGRAVVGALLQKLPVERIFLTAVFGKEPLYAGHGFLQQNNAMALYAPEPRADAIAAGVLTPETDQSAENPTAQQRRG